MTDEQLKSFIGKRIRLTLMENDPDPIPIGTTGIVINSSQLSGYYQLGVEWDNGRKLSLICPPDEYELI